MGSEHKPGAVIEHERGCSVFKGMGYPCDCKHAPAYFAYMADQASYLAVVRPSNIQVGGDHYKDMPIQPAEFCQKNRLNFCESAVIKYVCRHGNKRGAEDIKKAIHFLQLLLEFDYPHHATEERCSDLDAYQDCAADTAIYPVLGHPIVYPALGLAGEAGEVAEKVKKAMRDDGLELTEERRKGLKKELGDTLWYVSEVARQAGFKLSEIAWGNIEKLAERKAQGTINGEGDER